MNVYTCVTLYHVYITLLLIYNSGSSKTNNIIFLNANDESVYQQYMYIYEQLTKRGYLCDIRLRSLNDRILGRERKKNKNQLNIVQQHLYDSRKGFILYNFAWNNSYVYPASNLLYKNCRKAIFVEESTLIAKLEQEKKWKKLIHSLLGNSVDFYKDKKVEQILVQRPELFPKAWSSKLKKLNIPALTENIGQQDKNEILTIMSEYGSKLTEILQESEVGILYTCPFSEQNIIPEQEKIEQVVTICNYYKRYGKILVKPHPRDLSSYPFSKDILILPRAFPSELLSLIGYKFKFAVSVCSSAVDTTNAEYKINMCEEFYNHPKFFLKDIKGNIVN